MLVGPKGSGKTHVGRLLEAHLGVRFFHVEPLWMEYHAACAAAGRPVSLPEGIARIHPHIADALAEHPRVCVETTGASPEILHDLLALGARAGLLLVRVAAPLPVCLARIRRRDPTHQIPLDEDAVRTVHARSTALDLPFDVVLHNADLDDDDLLRRFRARGL